MFKDSSKDAHWYLLEDGVDGKDMIDDVESEAIEDVSSVGGFFFFITDREYPTALKCPILGWVSPSGFGVSSSGS